MHYWRFIYNIKFCYEHSNTYGVVMNISKNGLAEITGYEGICTAPYVDSGGEWTFGIGHTRFDGAPDPRYMEKGVDHPLEEIFALFQARIGKYVKGVSNVLTVDVTQAQFDALVSFHFNTGAIAHSTLLTRVNGHYGASSIASAFGMWNHDNGKVVPGLTKRRAQEARLFNEGIYLQGGMAMVSTADIRGREHNYRSMNILQYIQD